MKTEIRANGSIELHLVPETPIERLATEQMAEAAAKGQRVTIHQNDSGALVLGLEA